MSKLKLGKITLKYLKEEGYNDRMIEDMNQKDLNRILDGKITMPAYVVGKLYEQGHSKYNPHEKLEKEEKLLEDIQELDFPELIYN